MKPPPSTKPPPSKPPLTKSQPVVKPPPLMKPPPTMKPPTKPPPSKKPPSSHVVSDLSFAAATKAPLKVNLPPVHQAALAKPHIPVRPLPQRIAHRPTRIPTRPTSAKNIPKQTTVPDDDTSSTFSSSSKRNAPTTSNEPVTMDSFSANANEHALLNSTLVDVGKYLFLIYE